MTRVMATIELVLPEQQFSALEQKARAANLTVDELLKEMIRAALAQPSATEQAMNYVLTKNKSLYERLA